MKHVYTKVFLLCAAALLLCLPVKAQTIYLGYATPNETIYEYDGLSVGADMRIGVAIRLTQEMLHEYAGCEISHIKAGWDDAYSTAAYDIFVTEKLGGEPLATAKGKSVKFGWNMLMLDQAVPITEETPDLYVGFYVDAKEGVCCVPKFYPHGGAGEGYLWMEGNELADGTEDWDDIYNLGFDVWTGTTLAIHAMLRDKDGVCRDRAQITKMLYDPIVLKADGSEQATSTAMVTMKNKGSNNLQRITVQCKQGEQVLATEVRLSSQVTPSLTKTMTFPVCAFTSGDIEYSITHINGNELAEPYKMTLNQLVVPAAVDSRHERLNLLEFYCSEDQDLSPLYFDSYVCTGLLGLEDKYSIVSQHMTDQFMLGDDEATQMALDFCDGDSAKVVVPAQSLNRTFQLANYYYGTGLPIDYCWYPEFGATMFKQLAAPPTFVALDVEGDVSADGKTVNAVVAGEIAEGIMPEGEPLYCTVYLVEDEVESTSQVFADEKTEEEYGGVYTHTGIIRRRLTPMYGNELETNSGSFRMECSTRFTDAWNKSNCRLVAFVHRGTQNDIYHRNVLNTAQRALGEASGIQNVVNSQDEQNLPVYDLQGRRVSKPAGGIYIRGGKKILL